jgi:hypothetical protein
VRFAAYVGGAEMAFPTFLLPRGHDAAVDGLMYMRGSLPCVRLLSVSARSIPLAVASISCSLNVRKMNLAT